MAALHNKTLAVETGIFCNNHCVFCYQKGYRHLPEYQKLVSKEEIISRMQWGIANGFDEVSFTGGEPSNTTLIVCEGEINACSIWQAVKDQHVHVFSLGSESATIPPAFVDYAAKHARAAVWMDKAERAQVVTGALPGAYGFKSPNGQDANDLLRAEMLPGILLRLCWQAAPDKTAKAEVLRDVWNAAQVWPGADEYTLSMLADLAKKTGVTLGANKTPADMPTWRRALATLDADKTPTVADESGVQNAA